MRRYILPFGKQLFILVVVVVGVVTVGVVTVGVVTFAGEPEEEVEAAGVPPEETALYELFEATAVA